MATSAWVTAEIGLGSGPYRLDLSRKASRRLGEIAALVAAQLAGDVDVENVSSALGLTTARGMAVSQCGSRWNLPKSVNNSHEKAQFGGSCLHPHPVAFVVRAGLRSNQECSEGKPSLSAVAQLVAISSGAIIPGPVADGLPLAEQFGALGAELHQLLTRRNGFYAFESALHVFPVGACDGVLDLATWNAAQTWRSGFGAVSDGTRNSLSRRESGLVRCRVERLTPPLSQDGSHLGARLRDGSIRAVLRREGDG